MRGKFCNYFQRQLKMKKKNPFIVSLISGYRRNIFNAFPLEKTRGMSLVPNFRFGREEFKRGR